MANGEIASAASTPLGTTLIAMGIVYTAIIMPLMAGISTLTANREADRKEIAGLYATLGELKGNKEFSQGRFEEVRRDIERAEKHLGEIAMEQRSRTSLVASVPGLEKRLDALAARFNEAERRGVPSPAEQISELRGDIRHLRDMIPMKP